MTETIRLLADDQPDRYRVLQDRVRANPCLVVDLLALAKLDSDPIGELEDRLLRRLGGSLRRPPELHAGWERSDDLVDLAHDAKELLSSSIGPLLGIDDPRAGLLAPFWRRIVGEALPTAIVIDDPAYAAKALAARNDLSTVQALALYERYFRTVAASCTSQQVIVIVSHHGVLDTAARDALCQFVSTKSGVNDEAINGLGKRAAVDTLIQSRDLSSLVLPEIRQLFEAFSRLGGAHEQFLPNIGCPESSWTSALLEGEHDLEHVVAGLEWATRQIEPIVRARPLPPTEFKKETQNPSEVEEELEVHEPDKFGPYPLNASEDRRAYHRWLHARHEPVIVGGIDDPPRRRARTPTPRNRRSNPLVSIVVPVWRTPLWALERCVSSVLAQTIGDWELCLCDDASQDSELSEYLRSLTRIDRRISICALKENGGISAATNAAIATAKGRFIAFLDHDDELAPNALEEVAKAIAATPDVDVLYSDEDKIEALGERFDPLFKPDWSPDLLLSFAYICHLTVVRRELIVELGGLRSEFDGSQDYDLSLRATERARHIVHIPEVLYHWRTLPGSAASDSPAAVAKPWAYEAGRRAIEDALRRRGEQAEVNADEKFPGRYHVRRAIASKPLVSIIIPFRDEPALLATCASSLRAQPGYDRIELVLVDNGSELPETAALLARLDADRDVRVVSAPGPFNWAAINNAAVNAASGDMLLFANNDIEARVPRWLEALLGHALRPEVGAVGARLIYPDGAIQHAGVVIGLGGIAGHPLRGLPGTHPGYNSMAIQTRNCSVVTGACMMTRRDIFESVGGFNELLPVAFNDVDYCLKLREKGFLIVYTPLAELIHHESRSRGHTDDLVESRRIVSRWSEAIAAGDPYLSKHLSHWRYWCPLSTAQEDDRWKTYLETSVLTRVSSSNT